MVGELADAPAQLVRIGDEGQIERIIPVRWPPQTEPDDPFSLVPLAVPTLIEGLEWTQ